jgi:two-component system NtrC family sensor kinase
LKKQLETELHGFMLELDTGCMNDDMYALLGYMEEGLQRVSDIVQNMSVFSRLHNEHTEFSNINNCIESTHSMLKSQVSEKVELLLDLQDLPEIEMNEVKINQVITNLLINASQSIQNYGKITISSTIQDNKIVVQVADNGCGIEEGALNKVFDPFYTTKKEGEGTGLGLAISRDIAHEHDGELSVISTLGEGSVFTLTLPITHVVIH